MNLIDKWYELTNPKEALSRERNRAALSVIRAYNASKPNRNSGSYSRKNSRASDEVSRAHRGLAGGAQDLVRNTAVGKRIKSVIASNMVGTGIKPDYIGGSKRRVDRYKNSFDAWANSTACDFEGHSTFYGLQHLWAATVVESGGVLIRKVINNALAMPLVLQTLEQQYLDESKSGQVKGGGELVNGIEYSATGQVVGYWIKTRLKGYLYREESKFYAADDIIHIFDKERPGQHLGVSWFHPIADLIDTRQELRDAILTQQRIASCFGVVVKEPPADMGLGKRDNPLRDESGLPYSEMEPGMIAYVDANTDIQTVSPPNLSGTGEFSSEVIQDIAVGVGVTREQITGDFSKVNWASGRLARGEFYTNLDRWQQFMMLPALDRVHGWFDDLYTVIAGTVNTSRNWITPHRTAVNPKEELEVDIRKVRTAAMTPQQFTAKQGLKFEDAIAGWLEAKALFGDLPFDFDPSKFSAAGNQLDDNDSASSNLSSKDDDEPNQKESKTSTDDSK